MIRAKTQVGPEDHGRRMSLEDFAEADGKPGHLYELARGRVVVVDVPGLPHGFVVQNVNEAIRVFRAANPETIYYIASGSDCALRLPGLQSERHPDLAVYLTGPAEEGSPWESWAPDIAIEVVSRGGETRDYEEKREEYLAAGVREYWIVEPRDQTVLVLTRRADVWAEKKLTSSDKLHTYLLPGFEVRVADLFKVPHPPKKRRKNGRKDR
ncbi:MAG: Uma2 family endonuclease [Planctomycetota bacterium]